MKNIILTQIIIFYIESIYSQSSTPVPSACLSKYGNPLNGTCMAVDNCTGAALEGNCGLNLICCIPDKSPIINSNNLITKDLYFRLLGKTRRTEALYGFFVKSLQSANVHDQIYKAAAYFSQLIGESNYFRDFESRVVDSDFNVDLGNNKTGDGSFYQGRGAILLRGKTNYMLANSNCKKFFKFYSKLNLFLF